MMSFRVGRWLLVLCVAHGVLLAQGHGQDAPQVEAKGKAEILAMPDYAEFRLRLAKSAETVDEAARQASVLEADVRAAIKTYEITFSSLTTRGPVITSILQPTAYYEVTLQVPLSVYRTPDNDPAKFGGLCDTIVAMAKDMGCGFFGPKFGMTKPQDIERETVARAVENAYNHGEAVARTMSMDIAAVREVHVDKVTWNSETRTKETPDLTRIVCTADVRVVYACSLPQR